MCELASFENSKMNADWNKQTQQLQQRKLQQFRETSYTIDVVLQFIGQMLQ